MRVTVLVVQIGVLLGALAVRLAAPGWWMALILMTFGMIAAIILAPLILSTVLTLVMARTQPLRIRTVVTLVFADAGLLTFTATLPDFTDTADDHPVPIAGLVTGDSNVSAVAADKFSEVAVIGMLGYLVAAIFTIVLAITDHRAEKRALAARPSAFTGPSRY